MKKRYLRPIIQDFLIASAGGKFLLLAIIDDYKLTWFTGLAYVGTALWMFAEVQVLIKYGGKPSLFIE